MTGPVEWLVGLVLGVDALVIAGLVVSRLTGRSRRSNGSVPPDGPIDRLQEYTASGTTAIAVAEPEVASGATATAIAEPEAAPAIAEPEVAPEAPVAEAGRELESPDATIEPADAMAIAEPADLAATTEPGQVAATTEPGQVAEMAAADSDDSPIADAAQPVAAATDWDAAVAETPAIPDRGPRPMGLDFGPTWVDPVAMAAEAAAEWRRGLRRDLALAAWRGRPGLVMNLKLDVESEATLSIADVARFEAQLHQAISRLVRVTDHFDRTGPGRFHVMLSEMSESAALAVAERIRHGFADTAGGPAPRLLIGWAAMETEGDVALALERAAERLDGIPLDEA